MIVMKEIEVVGVRAQILDAGCQLYRPDYVIPIKSKGDLTVLDLKGLNIPDADIDVHGETVKSLVDDGLLKPVAGGYKIVFKWHN